MPRRRRRASTSSVETIDESRIHWRQESSVLKAGPKDDSVNLWPLFELQDAVVLSKDGRTPENALDVAVKGPFMVRGRLIIDDDIQKSRLLMKTRDVPIEVRHVTSYSIGESDDRRPVIWVLGRGGWFEINPSTSYRPIFNKMCQATTFYYKLLDIYNAKAHGKSKKSKGRTNKIEEEITDAFLKYAISIGDGSTSDEVLERCDEFATFFITQFLQDRELLHWETTPFFKWLTTRHQDLYNKTLEMIQNPPKRTRSPPRSLTPLSTRPAPARIRARSSAATSDGVEIIDAEDFATGERSSRSKTELRKSNVIQTDNTSTATTGPPPASEISEDEAFATVLDAWGVVFSTQAAKRKELSPSALLNQCYTKFKFPMYKVASGSHKVPVEEVFHYNASKLLQHLDKDTYQPHSAYSWLQHLAKTKFSPKCLKMSDFPYAFVVRGSRQTKPKEAVMPPAQTEDGPESSSDSPPRTGKTVKFDGKRRSRKSGLRLATSSKKRPHSAMDTDSDSETSSTKRSHFFSDADDTMGDTGSHDERGTTPQGNRDSEEYEEPIKIVIRADRLPDATPRGKDGTWVCDQDDCSYIVRGPDADECQKRIQEHYDQHQEQSERLNVAVTESARSHNPINHLLEKLRELGEKEQAKEQARTQSNGVKRIKRKFLF